MVQKHLKHNPLRSVNTLLVSVRSSFFLACISLEAHKKLLRSLTAPILFMLPQGREVPTA